MRNKGTFRRLPRTAFEPLKITAHLQCGVIADASMPLDAVLYYTAMRERYGSQDATWSGADHRAAVPGTQLPLARVDEHLPTWYYAASFAQWSRPVAEGMEYWNRRFDLGLSDLIDFGRLKARIDPSAGALKSYHMPVFYRHALYVQWHALGHRASIEGLLAHITHLGKKTSQGWGAVLRWSVEECAQDWSVYGPDGRLMRAIPSADGAGTLTGYRPSYWLPKNQARCRMPLCAS